MTSPGDGRAAGELGGSVAVGAGRAKGRAEATSQGAAARLRLAQQAAHRPGRARPPALHQRQ